jgi:hypothetical protein
MAKKWEVLARHKWVSGAIITESALIDSEEGTRRYTATIRGWTNFKIWQGPTAYRDMKTRLGEIIQRVTEIRDRIDGNDQTVFTEKGAW